MKNIKIDISLLPGADILTALSTTLVIAKALKATLNIKMNGFTMSVSHESYLSDLYEVYSLNEKLVKIKK